MPGVYDWDKKEITDESHFKDLDTFKDVKDTTTFDTPVATLERNVETRFIEMMERAKRHRQTKVLPPGYYDNLIYDHRMLSIKYGLKSASTKSPFNKDDTDDTGDPTRIFRVGDCMFTIPPEFISVISSSSHDSIQGLRQENSTQTKNGYIRKDIQASIMLNGMNQINGYKVQSPIGTPYEVDGLRALISQFRYTPFVPIENYFVNLVNNVDMVALRNLTINTIEGFPDTLNVTLSMQEFNSTPYLQIPDSWVTDCIDWDLYRWFTQRPLIDKNHPKYLPRVSSGATTKQFKFSVLDEEKLQMSYEKQKEALSKDDFEIYDEDVILDLFDSKNYVELVSSKDRVVMSNLQLSMSNLMPQIQLSDHEAPTFQYLGATDTNINVVFETRNSAIVNQFDELNKKAAKIARDNTFKNGLGFVMIENELINMTGCKYVLIEQMSINTVPSFPGLYQISMSCVSFDPNRVKRDKLIAFRPFPDNREGTRDDLITPTALGFKNKLLQDAQAEKELMQLEMYPDLCLPKYDEVDKVLESIKKYRVSIGCEEVHAETKLKRPLSRVQGSVVEAEYNGYVDPDFYVFVPVTSSDLEKGSEEPPTSIRNIAGNEAELFDVNDKYSAMDYMEGIKAVADKTSPLKYKPGYEPENSDSRNWFKQFNKQFGNSGSASFGSNNYLGNYEQGDKTKDPTQIQKVVGNPFLDFLIDRFLAKCWYCYGSAGEMLDHKRFTVLYNTHGAKQYEGVDYSQLYGTQVFDCSGFISWAIRKVGLHTNPNFRETTNYFMTDTLTEAVKGANMRTGEGLKPGDLFVNSGHIGVYVGDIYIDGRLNKLQILHAASPKNGIIFSTLSVASNESFGVGYKVRRIKNFDAQCALFLKNNPKVYVEDKSDNEMSIDDELNYIKETSKNDTYKATVGNFGQNHEGKMCDRWNDFIVSASKEFGLDPNLVKTMMYMESRGNPSSVNASSGATGLMQIMLNYHANKFPSHIQESGNYTDPYQNIRVGCMIIRGYGDMPWVKWDKTRLLTAYNAGPYKCKWIFEDKTHSMPSETVKYVNMFTSLHNHLLNNGGSAGSTRTLNNGMRDYDDKNSPIYGPAEDRYYFGTSEDSYNYDVGGNYTDDTAFINSEYERIYEETLGVNIDRVGVPILSRVACMNVLTTGVMTYKKIMNMSFKLASEQTMEIYDKNTAVTNRSDAFNKIYEEEFKKLEKFVAVKNTIYFHEKELKGDSNKYSKDSKSCVESMLVDHASYSCKGLLARAFPAYLVAVIDEQQDHLDRKWLWNNYYILRSVIDINVYGAYDSPVSNAILRVSNINETLDKVYKQKLAKDLLFKKSDLFNRFLYEYLGVVTFQTVTDEMLKWKNRISDEINLAEGARLHIRMGYGSNPARYPTVFNGIIDAVQPGEIIEITASSDGHELINTQISQKPNDTNRDAKLGVETSNIIKTLLTRRESSLINFITAGNFKIRNAFNIQHFGSWWDVAGDANETFWYDNKFVDDNYLKEMGYDQEIDMELDTNRTTTSTAILIQPDLLMNVYKGNYKAEPFLFKYHDVFDGEANYKFFVGGKTPWDVMKMCEKGVPDFVCYPRFFGFESRLFYGLPTWQHKYKYLIEENQYDDRFANVFLEMKAFSQIHECTSLDSIIENTISVDTRNHHTNAVGAYTVGGDISITPVVMSDFTIEWARQSTKTIDTTAVQDLPFVPSILDKLINWSGIYNAAKNLSINICVSELMNSWREIYTGTLLVLGQPEIKPWDNVYIDDHHLHMKGMFMVREVVHNMSVETGFTTSIVPGMIVHNSLKYSGSLNVGRTALSVVGAFIARNAVKKWSLYSYFKIANMVKLVKNLEFTVKAVAWTKGKAGGVKNFLSLKVGQKVLTFLKKGEFGLKILKFIGQLMTHIKTFKTLITTSKIFTSVSAIIKKTLLAASAINPMAIVTFVGYVLLDMAISALLTKIIDMFSYKNTIIASPLMIERPDARAYPLIGKVKGGKNIVPYNITNEGINF